ncbi:MAG: C4-dicarboxylate ABC transporter [Bergeyella zoohelcum]|nr:C4-dicarboxylate ABC transporter [Bergeyella zoohelcum]
MIFSWLSLFTGVCYVVLGVFVMLNQWFIIPLQSISAYGLGVLLVLYGFFRIFRAVKRIINKGDE